MNSTLTGGDLIDHNDRQVSNRYIIQTRKCIDRGRDIPKGAEIPNYLLLHCRADGQQFGSTNVCGGSRKTNMNRESAHISYSWQSPKSFSENRKIFFEAIL